MRVCVAPGSTLERDCNMKISYRVEACRLAVAAVLFASFSFIPYATAQERARSYFIDLNSRTVTELKTLGGDYIFANAINDAGQVVGLAQTSGGKEHAFITGPDGVGLRDLGTLGGAHSRAHDINEAGQVVGESLTAEGESHAFITGPDGMGMRDIGTLGATFSAYSTASGINNAGQVAGYSSTPEGPYHAFITGPNGMGLRDLGTLGGYESLASDINDAGQVSGTIRTLGLAPEHYDRYRGFITGPDGAGMRAVGTLTGGESFAGSINDAGQVAGTSRGGDERAFITGPDGMGMKDLGTLAGGFSSYASGLNDVGQVVGGSSPGGESRSHAFITGPDGEGMMDLNSLVDLPQGVILTNVWDINNNGQAIASMSFIPEPETHALMLAGLGLLAFMGRRGKAA
jgi:probable HAF family extracellular repeat protein